MMLESLSSFLKTLPYWLMITAEVLIVGVLFLTAGTFLAGIWTGLGIIGRRGADIETIEFFPPKITFRE